MDWTPEDVLFNQGKDNPGGMAEIHYYCLKSDIKVFPQIATTANANRGRLVGEFEMHPNKYFRKLYCTLEKGSVTYTQVGGRDSKSFENKAKLFIPDMNPNVNHFLENLKNSRIVLVCRLLDGQLVVLGNHLVGAESDTVEGGSGEAVADSRGATYTIRSIPWIAPFYEPATIVDGLKVPPLEPAASNP